MKQRIITAVIFMAIILPVIFIPSNIVFTIVFSIVSTWCSYEVLSSLLSLPLLSFSFSPSSSFDLLPSEKEKAYSFLFPLLVLSFFMTLLTSFSTSFLFLFSFFFFAFFFLKGMGRMEEMGRIALITMIPFYISLSFSLLILMKKTAFEFVLLSFAGTWICDTAALLIGKGIGKRKLIEKISPNKTVEGAVGGILITALLLPIVAFASGFTQISMIMLVGLGVLVSVLAQFGDLAMSLIKRLSKIKDFGDILQGHGGLLDRFDSLLAVVPVMYFISSFFIEI